MLDKKSCDTCLNKAPEGYCREVQSDRFGRKAESNHCCRMYKSNGRELFNSLFGKFDKKG